MDLLGIILIAIAWGIEFYYVNKKSFKIQPFFILFYTLGAALLTVNGYNSNQSVTATLNLISLLLPAYIFLKMK